MATRAARSTVDERDSRNSARTAWWIVSILASFLLTGVGFWVAVAKDRATQGDVADLKAELRSTERRLEEKIAAGPWTVERGEVNANIRQLAESAQRNSDSVAALALQVQGLANTTTDMLVANGRLVTRVDELVARIDREEARRDVEKR